MIPAFLYLGSSVKKLITKNMNKSFGKPELAFSEDELQ